jgi:hypothetical protein
MKGTQKTETAYLERRHGVLQFEPVGEEELSNAHF